MTELEALAAYHERRDADAFRRLVLAYQGMVYCTCRRVLGSDADAEDAAQETFLKLARAAGQIRSNPAAWLHACAITTARDKLRSNRSRQSREAEWATMHTIEGKDDWHELLPVVDDCIADLPEDDRELLLAYYFAGCTQADLGASRGISQPAVKKRLDRIVDDLRSRLHKLGYAVPLGLLILFLSERACDAAVPATLSASLLKIGIAGVGEGVAAAPAPTASAASGGILAELGAKITAVAVAAGIIVGVGVVAHKQFTKPDPPPGVIAEAETEEPAAPPAAQQQEIAMNKADKQDAAAPNDAKVLAAVEAARGRGRSVHVITGESAYAEHLGEMLRAEFGREAVAVPPQGADLLPTEPIVAAPHERVAFAVLHARIRGAEDENKANQMLASAEAIVVSMPADEMRVPYRISRMKDGKIEELLGEMQFGELMAKYAAWMNLDTRVRHEGDSVLIEGTPPPVTKGFSYARGLEAVLGFLGTQADYDTIMGDSGRAFIIQSEDGGPIIDGNVDVGWWPMGAWGIKMRLDFVSRCVGREIRVIAGDDGVYRANPAEHYRQRFEQEVKASIDAGSPVLAEHDMCFIVTGYDDGNPPLLGNWALSETAGTIRVPDHPWGMIVIGAPQPGLDRKAADVQAVQHAVALIRDEPQVTVPMFFEEWRGVRGRFTGQKSFALWAASLRDMEHVGQGRYHGNMCLHLGISRRGAVAYLQAMAGRHPAEVSAHLTAAADLYSQELKLLATADAGQAAMTSRNGREKFAQLVEEMAGVEAQAGDELAKALAAWGQEIPMNAPKAAVKRDAEKVWIEGVPSLGWDKHQCTYAGALEAALAATERPVSYTQIMGVSGLAFRTRWYQGRIGQKWCPSSPVGEFPEEIAATQKATGWPMQVVAVPEDPKMERFAAQIVASIDAGRPVPAYEPGLNMDVIYGYKDGGGTMLLKDYFKGDIEMPVGKLGWMLLILQDPVQPLSKRDAFVQGLRIAVANWQHAPRPHEKGEYLLGDAALARWADDLGKIGTLNQADRDNLAFVSGWCFASMLDARTEAASFLEQNANELVDAAKAAILRAAGIYRQEANSLRAVLQGNQPDARKREFLGEARKLEAAAIAEIENALNSAR